jgi:hypothetical protein
MNLGTLIFKKSRYAYEQSLIKSKLPFSTKYKILSDSVKTRYWNVLYGENEKDIRHLNEKEKYRLKYNIDALEHLRNMDNDGSTEGCGCVICKYKHKRYLLELQVKNDRTIRKIANLMCTLQQLEPTRYKSLTKEIMEGRDYGLLVLFTKYSLKGNVDSNKILSFLAEREINNSHSITMYSKAIKNLNSLTGLPVYKKEKITMHDLSKMFVRNANIEFNTFCETLKHQKPEEFSLLKAGLKDFDSVKVFNVIVRNNDINDNIYSYLNKALLNNKRAIDLFISNRIDRFALKVYYEALKPRK